MVRLILAATESDLSSLGGASGWAGAGLLGLVLAWLLLKYLPDKDRQFATLVESFRLEMDKERASHILAYREQGDRFDSNMKAERQQCHEDHQQMLASVTSNTSETIKLAQEVRALAGSVGNLLNRMDRQP